MIDILRSYIPKFIVDINRNNDNIIKVSTQYFSPSGDVYTLDRRAVAPSVVQTEQDIQDLRPEVSTVYPFKIITPLDYDGSSIVLSPSATTIPTASQNYYAPVWFERYDPVVLNSLDVSFKELSVI